VPKGLNIEAVPSTITITGDTSNGSPIITSPSSTEGLAIGQVVTGPGIPSGTTISSFSPLTLSQNALDTATGIQLLIYSAGGFLLRNLVAQTTGDVASSSATVSNVASMTGIVVGQFISGTGIIPGTTVLSIDS